LEKLELFRIMDPQLCNHDYGMVLTKKKGRRKGKKYRICQKCGTKVPCKDNGDIV